MKQTKAYISILSAIASFCVVMMHVGNVSCSMYKVHLDSAGYVIDGICYFAVPVFFMISGANLIDYRQRYGTTTFFKKRFLKTVVPFVVWSLIGIAYEVIALDTVIDGGIGGILLAIITTEYVESYWFFIPLFMAYLSMPILTAIEPKKKVFFYMIVVGVVFIFVVNYFESIAGITIDGYNDVQMVSGWTVYLLIGYYLDHYEIPKWLHYVIYALGIYGVLMMTVVTINGVAAWGHDYTIQKNILGLPVLLYASAIFLLFKDLSGTKVEAAGLKVVKIFEGTTLGIYLIHRFVIEILKRLPFFNPMQPWQRIVMAIAVFVISSLVVRLLQKIPIIRRIVP